MFWKLNLRKKYEKISVNAFDYGKLHEITDFKTSINFEIPVEL
jgi:hypothetical protein